jgi:hypothetical protein
MLKATVTAIFVGGPRHGQWHRVALQSGQPPMFVDVATGGHADGEPASNGRDPIRPPSIRYVRRLWRLPDQPGAARWSYCLADTSEEQLREALLLDARETRRQLHGAALISSLAGRR